MIIETVGLRKTYYLGETVVRALDAVDVAIDEGEMVALSSSFQLLSNHPGSISYTA